MSRSISALSGFVIRHPRWILLVAGLLVIGLGPDATEALLDLYCGDVPPSFFASEEARKFAEWAQAHKPGVPGFADILRFEAGLVEAIAESETVEVAMHVDIEALIAAIHSSELPDVKAIARNTTLEISLGETPRVVEREAA